MLCDACAGRLGALRERRKARVEYDLEIDAFVWEDERSDLCDECARDYRVVLNVRTQLWHDENPSLDFRMVWDRFRESCPGWIGFRRGKPSGRPPPGGAAKDEFVDDD